MTADRMQTVADRPAQLLIVFDGECEFCRQWVRRWAAMTGARVAYQPFQEVGASYPEIGRSGFQSRVWLIEPDGIARGGAGAVFRLYELTSGLRWPARAYRRVPGVAWFTEFGYDFVARHRSGVMRLVRWTIGSIDRRPA